MKSNKDSLESVQMGGDESLHNPKAVTVGCEQPQINHQEGRKMKDVDAKAVSTETMPSLAETPADAILTDGATTAPSTIESAKNETTANAPDNKQSDEAIGIDPKHKRFTNKEFACFGLMNEVVWFVFNMVYKTGEHSYPARTIYLFLKDKQRHSSISTELGFICSKLGCKNAAQLAKVLAVSEDEIFDLLDDEGEDIPELVSSWETLPDW